MDQNESLNVSPFIYETIRDFFPLIGLGIIACIYIWSWGRAGSAFFILQRFLGLLGGNKELSNPEASTAWTSVRDFYSMRLRTGLKFKNNEQLRLTLSWLKEEKIGLEEIIQIRPYFDVEKIKINPPNLTAKKKENYFLSIFIACFLAASVVLSASDRAFLIIKQSGTLFVAKQGSAHSLDPFLWSLSAEKCSEKVLGISGSDQKVICELIQSEDRTYIKSVIFQQRVISMAMLVFLALISLSLISSWRQAKTAHAINSRLDEQQDGQLSLFSTPDN
ncbi:DUF6216 family protein [Atopomonas hussainii]|uniref:DUF6216 family protein n=1 Tax=Atopomonas hussainii TaxID=1429083 RepID=UPI001115056A|nr:DUF6216 family protein [Atopomonas hussainii]